MDKKEITEQFCSFFTKIAAKLQGYLPVLTSFTWKNNTLKFLKHLINPENTIFKLKLVILEYIVKIINKLKSSMSPGLDNIPVSIVKDTRDILSYPLCHLINLSLQNSIFPDCKKYVKVIPYSNLGVKQNSTTIVQYQFCRFRLKLPNVSYTINFMIIWKGIIFYLCIDLASESNAQLLMQLHIIPTTLGIKWIEVTWLVLYT